MKIVEAVHAGGCEFKSRPPRSSKRPAYAGFFRARWKKRACARFANYIKSLGFDVEMREKTVDGTCLNFLYIKKQE